MQGQDLGQAARAQTRFDYWNERIANLRERIQQATNETDKFIDQVVGTQPAEVANAAEPVPVSSASEGMDDAIMRLDAAVDHLNRVTHRLWETNLVHRPGVLDEMPLKRDYLEPG